MLSRLSIYSIGIVTKDKDKDSPFIKAIPYEVITDLDGEVSSFSESIKTVLEDEDGYVFSGTDKVASMRCEWLPFGDLRTTAPDVVLGEQVIIWRYGQEEDYYWTPKRQDLLNRKLEHIVFTLSNTKDDQDESKPYEKSITFTLSTRDKVISLVTDDNDKEKAKYDFTFDLKEGLVSLTDNHDNVILLNSPERKLKVVVPTVEYECKTFTCTGNMEVLGNLVTKGTTVSYGNLTCKSKIFGLSSLDLSGGIKAGGTVRASHFIGNPGSVKYRT